MLINTLTNSLIEFNSCAITGSNDVFFCVVNVKNERVRKCIIVELNVVWHDLCWVQEVVVRYALWMNHTQIVKDMRRGIDCGWIVYSKYRVIHVKVVLENETNFEGRTIKLKKVGQFTCWMNNKNLALQGVLYLYK